MKSLLLLAPVLFIAAPAAADTVHDTHRIAWHPAGKLPAATFHQRERDACVVQRHHQAGKSALPAPSGCELAAKQKSVAGASGAAR